MPRAVRIRHLGRPGRRATTRPTFIDDYRPGVLLRPVGRTWVSGWRRIVSGRVALVPGYRGRWERRFVVSVIGRLCSRSFVLRLRRIPFWGTRAHRSAGSWAITGCITSLLANSTLAFQPLLFVTGPAHFPSICGIRNELHIRVGAWWAYRPESRSYIECEPLLKGKG